MFNEFETKLTSDSDWEWKYIHIFKGIYIANSENEYKEGNRLQIYQENTEFTIEEKKYQDVIFNILVIKSDKNEVSIRSTSRISLEYIIFHSTQEEQKDKGRPLTFYPHLSNVESPLEHIRLKRNNYRGFINLIGLVLALTHLRLILDNYTIYGIIKTPKYFFKFICEEENLIFLCGSFVIGFTAVVLTFLLEIIASKSKYVSIYPYSINIFHGLNLCGLLLLPLQFHMYKLINPITGVSVLFTVTIVFLKLYSYIHFWCDVRIFIKNKSKLIKSDFKNKQIQSELYKEIEEVVENYPKNLLFMNLLKFLLMPVLCFQYKYPKTNQVRKEAIIKYSIQLIVCVFIIVFICNHYMIPTVNKSMKFILNDDYLNIFEKLLKLAIPFIYVWILLFYAFFHCWLNLIAELTKFGDRNFYGEWWNSLYLEEYWRTWNMPTHYWFVRHIYNPLRRRAVSRYMASAVVFFISAFFHEYIISGALGYLNYWAFIAIFSNNPIQISMTIIKGIMKKSQIMNVMFWITFCFLGQPLCVMLYFYNYYKRFDLNI